MLRRLPMNRIIVCLILIGLGVFYSESLWAQAPQRCLTMSLDSALRAEYPELGSLAQHERWLQHAIEIHQATTRDVQTVYVIPVIVHVIHDAAPVGTGANLAASRIASQLQVLNEDFRRMMGTPGHNSHPSGADVEIEFCPATIDPEGQPLLEPGIHRVDRSELDLSAPPYSPSSVRGGIMTPLHWDPERYMNIYVVDLQDDVLGFAQLPNQSTLSDLPTNHGPAPTDGVVIDPDNFGRGQAAAAPYDQGRTTTHEVGHWLGLRHVWGDGNCNVDDFCGDTPDAANPNYGCPSNPSTCGSADMFQNYMDYTDDACMNIFTQCQRTRMRTVMTQAVRRANLLSSTACEGQLSPLARFSVDRQQVCAGSSVRFSDESLYQPTSWSWSFPGGTPASASVANPEVVYLSPGTYGVSLTVSNAQGSQTFSDSVFITVLDQSGEFFYEDFESGLAAWQVDNPDGSYGWDLKNVAGNSGSLAPFVNHFLYGSTGQRDGLISPPLDLSNYGDLNLSFEYAYRPYSANEQDSLLVLISIDGGASFPHRVYANAQGGSTPFATGPQSSIEFVPTNADDWCGTNNGAGCITLGPAALWMLAGQSDVRLRFETVNDFGNNIYIDNVRLSGTCYADLLPAPVEPREPLDRWLIFPNPASRVLHLSWQGAEDQWLQISLVDLMGRRVYSRQEEVQVSDTLQIPVQHLSRGTYLLHLQSQGHSPQVEKIQIR
jgi:PKD repeat protein